MYKDKYKDNYIVVLQALKNAETFGNTTHLYLLEENGLANIPFSEVKDILTSMNEEGMIKIIGYPKMSVLLYDNKPITDSLPELFRSSLPKEPPRNYYQIVINKGKFNLVYNYYCIPRYLLSSLPSSEQDKKKYKVLRKIAELLVNSKEVESFLVAESFIRPLDARKGKKVKLNRVEYKRGKQKYDSLIENRLKTLRVRLEPFGFTVQFRNDMVKLVEI